MLKRIWPATSALFAIFLLCAPAMGQVAKFAGDASGENGEYQEYAGRFRTDRPSNRRLAKAQELMAEARWAEAIGFLETVLEAKEDFWFQPALDKSASLRSVKQVALDLIKNMPAAAREAYELHCGATARRMLETAMESGDRAAMEEVHRRFFHTEAGYLATHRLAMYDLDHGHPLPAALLFEKLRDTPIASRLEPMLSLKLAVSWDRAGMPEKAKAALLSLKQQVGGGSVMLAGRSTELFKQDALALEWLRSLVRTREEAPPPGAEEITMFRGDPSRNAYSLGGAPLLNPRWAIPTANEKSELEDHIADLLNGFLDRDQVALPALHPLAVRLDLHQASVLNKDQVRNWPGFIQALAGPDVAADSPEAHLLSLLSKPLQTELREFAPQLSELERRVREAGNRQLEPEVRRGVERLEALKPRVVAELNHAMTRRDFYDQEAWSHASRVVDDALNTEARDWLKRGVNHLEDDELFRANRCVLDATFKRKPRDLITRSYCDVVLMRCCDNLLALDFVTGKRVWEIPKDPDDDVLGRLTARRGRPTNQQSVSSGLMRRLFQDNTFGTLSSDGTYVFSVEDLPISAAMTSQQLRVFAFNQARAPNSMRDYNKLQARDIRTGKLAWEVGGPKSEELELAGMFFLGPPLPLDGMLYVLAEIQGEVRLVVLDPVSGALQWSQTLYLVEQTVPLDMYRPVAGVSPSYADGVLVCPTAAGAVVAVDLTSRSLLWGYRYQTDSSNYGLRQQAIAINRIRQGMQQQPDHWNDSLATISGGRVILTPVDSDEMYCLNLVDGEELWKRKRGNGLYVGGIYDNKVVVVGRREVTALNLADGEPAWKPASTSIPTPCGRGFLSGNMYYVPVVNSNERVGEVLALDIQGNGRVVSRTRSRSKVLPGNLICFRGTVISQGVMKLESFRELSGLEREIARDLQLNPNDPVALQKRGEVLAQRGRIQEAIEHLRKSLELRDDPHTRQLLVDSLLEGLRVDFKANRGNAEQIESLIQQLPTGTGASADARARFLRLMALGLQEVGERDKAFGIYLRFVSPEIDQDRLERIEGGWKVQQSRWVRGQLRDLWSQANAEERAKMDNELNERLVTAQKESKPLMLEQFVRYFGDHPLADRARLELAQVRQGDHQWLAAELLLMKLEGSSLPQVAAEATARMARMLASLERPADAAIYYRKLSGPLAEVVCLEGKTGKQLLEELPSSSPVLKQLAGMTPWPVGKVVPEQDSPSSRRHKYHYPVRMLDSSEPFFRDHSLVLDQTQQNLVIRDSLGRELSQVTLQFEGGQRVFNPIANHARANGHLLLVVRSQYVFAVDTLGSGDDRQPRVMWTQNMVETGPGGVQTINFNQFNRNGRWQVVPIDQYGEPIGQIGPVTNEMMVFQRRRMLITVDPITGKELWVQNDLPAGCELFGDDNVIVAVAPNGTEAEVFRSVDGQRVGKYTLPPGDRRLVTRGRRVLCWVEENNKLMLRLIDPWEQRTVWEKPFPAGSQNALVDADEVGVVDLEGNFSLFDIADGRQILAQKITPEANMNELYLLRSADRYVLVTSSPWQQQNNKLFVTQVNSGVNNPIIHGHVHLFDRNTGKHVASTAIERQALPLDQPRDLPILTFACRVYNRQRGNRSNDPPYELLCVDKRTGAVVHHDRTRQALNGMDLEGDPDLHKVRIKLLNGGITLKFTDQPAQEVKPPKDGEAKAKTDAPGQNPQAAAGQPGANPVPAPRVRVAVPIE